MENYVYFQGKKLRCGYTTGTCATAATKVAILLLLKKIKKVLDKSKNVWYDGLVIKKSNPRWLLL